MELIKPRYELKNARLLAGLTEAELAVKIGVDEETLRRWEAGTQTPKPWAVGELCAFFKVDHPRKLNLDAQFTVSTQSREDEIIEMLQDYDRRELLAILAKLPALAGVDLSVMFSTTVIAPEKLLNVCRAIINSCWGMLDRKGYTIADGLLSVCLPELERLATHLSKYQPEAASLVVEAKIIQIIIAGHKLDYKRRKQLGLDAVRIAEVSKDGNMHALALGWHGDIYKTLLQPGTAIDIFTTALKSGDDVSLLNKADIFMSLSYAYALEKNARLAREYAEQAQIAMPELPELDPLSRLIDLGQSTLDAREGNMYLILAEKFPEEHTYAQLAYDAFVRSTDTHTFSTLHKEGILINKAEAACAIGDMNSYLDCLEEGVPMTKQSGSRKHISKAVTIIQKAPRSWRNEQRYKELRKILTPSVILARK